MKKIKLVALVVTLVVLMLVPLGVQASGSLNVDADVFTGICSITASFDDCSNEPVSLEIIPADINSADLVVSSDALQSALQKITYLKTNMSNESGVANFEVLLKNTGTYTVRVHSMNTRGAVTEENIDIVSFSDAQLVWNNLVSSPAQNLPVLLEILNVTDELVLSYKSDADLMSLIGDYESIGSFTKENASALIARIKSDCADLTLLRDVLSQIKNAVNTTQIAPIVTVAKNADVLGISQYMSRYNALKNTKIADSAVKGKEFTKQEFQAAFLKGIEDAEEAEIQNTSAAPPKKPSASPSGSLGGFVGTYAPEQPAASALHPFTDISEVAWAEDAIASLYTDNIINGKTNNKFAPHDNITREEFVKIAVGVMGIEPVEGTPAFEDVNSSAWYTPYVNAAVSAGIISGYSDSIFGVGEFITRQDVAVILYRMHSAVSSGTSPVFSDSADISDYAKLAVEQLSAAGVITGADGKFMPKANATRAEAACMVHRMLNLMKEGK